MEGHGHPYMPSKGQKRNGTHDHDDSTKLLECILAAQASTRLKSHRQLIGRPPTSQHQIAITSRHSNTQRA